MSKMVAVNHVSNSLGTINPVREIAGQVRTRRGSGADRRAQWVAHGVTDVQDLDVDFYAFSGHKMMGPTGSGCSTASGAAGGDAAVSGGRGHD